MQLQILCWCARWLVAVDAKQRLRVSGAPGLVPTKCCHATNDKLDGPDWHGALPCSLPRGHDGRAVDGQRCGRGKVPQARHRQVLFRNSLVHVSR